MPPGKLNPVTIGADRSPWVPIGPVFGGAQRELSGVIGSGAGWATGAIGSWGELFWNAKKEEKFIFLIFDF